MGYLVTLQQVLKRSCIAAVAFVMAFSLSFCFPQDAQAANLPDLQTGEVRIHVLPFDNTDAIIIECDGHFGMVDSAEDSDSPDGSDYHYPNRPGTTKDQGHEAEVIAYMKKLKINSNNFDFYIGTHPHSDHIGTAAQIIREFHPKTIYTPVYDDELITSVSNLWDNQYVYDQLIAAAKWAEEEYGARFIQHLDLNYTEPGAEPDESEGSKDQGEGSEQDGSQQSKDENSNGSSAEDDDQNKGSSEGTGNSEGTNGSDDGNDEGAEEKGEDPAPNPNPNPAPDPGPKPEPEDPDPVAPNTGSPIFKLGSATIEILNYDEAYLTTKVPDANYFSYGVKVTAQNGRTAFLAGDINNYTDGDGNGTGDEDRLAGELGGSIDFYKMAHHGYEGSNSPDYLRAILKAPKGDDRCVVVQTGFFGNMPQETVAALNEKGARHYQASAALQRGQDAFVADLTADGVRTNADGDQTVIVQVNNEAPYACLYRDGLPYADTGWHEASDGSLYFFGEAGVDQGSSVALTDRWTTYEGKRVYVDSTGRMTAEWGKIDSKWYLFDAEGNMLHGWQLNNGKWYYLEADGSMATGWKKLGSTWYYLDAENGDMKTGWYSVNGVPYYSYSNGAMVSGDGWMKLDGVWGYGTSSGAFKTGWLKDKGSWYYLQDSGAMKTGWTQLDGTWYYLNGSGAMKTGWQKVGGTWYHFKGSGAMTVGWLKSGSKWYYLRDSGAMATGTLTIDGITYRFNSSGAMQ